MGLIPWLAAALSLWLQATSISDDASVELGVLTCTLDAAPDPGSLPPKGDSSEAGQSRTALCAFKSETGSEETYTARIRTVGTSSEPLVTLLWLVKGRMQHPLPAGFLQQSYAADARPPPDAVAPAVIGEDNPNVALYPMADRRPGSASTEKPVRTTGILIAGVELKLRSTSG